jgi:hypothetical protein
MSDMEIVRAFSERYAAFLVASVRAFERPGHRITPLIHRLPGCRALKPWKAVLGAAIKRSDRTEGLVLEFGVFKGDSCRFLARRHRRGEVHGFDSFEGFPDDARPDWRRDFAVSRLPKVPANVTLHKGFFDATLPSFVATWGGRRPDIRLIHIDCDLFSSAHCVLTLLGGWLRPGDILVFDELINYEEFLANEFLALFLLLERLGLDFDWCVTCGSFYPVLETGGRMIGGRFLDYRAAGYYQNQAIRLRAREDGPPIVDERAPKAIVRAVVETITPMIDAGLLTSDDLRAPPDGHARARELQATSGGGLDV